MCLMMKDTLNVSSKLNLKYWPQKIQFKLPEVHDVLGFAYISKMNAYITNQFHVNLQLIKWILWNQNGMQTF